MSAKTPGTFFSLEDLPPCAGGGVSRREFCAATGIGLVALGTSACTPAGGERISTGLEDDPVGSHKRNKSKPDGGADENSSDDLGTGQSPDLSRQQQGGCSGTVDCGAIANMQVGSAQYFSGSSYDIFVCRDQSGLFAMDALCTHRYCTLDPQPDQTFYCACHGAAFDFDGSHPTYPAPRGLQHYALCVDGSGHVLVDYNTAVAATVRA